MKTMTMTASTGGGGTQNSSLTGFWSSKSQTCQSPRHPELDSGSINLMNPAETQTGINRFRLGGRNDEGFSQSHHAKNKPAFTLAEVLITLGIIGVVAAITLPSLVQKQNEKETVVKLKKTYSALENAYRLAQNENGDITGWFPGTDVATNSKIFADNMKPYLKVLKECGFEEGCLTPGSVKHLNKTNYHDYDKNPREYKIILNDGTAVIYMLDAPTCLGSQVCGNIKIDTNGKKGEYRWGIDFFIFNITPRGIVPAGHSGDTKWVFENFCNMSDNRLGNGIGCAAWVIFNENMDYLHCSDLSWDGKKKCSK